MVETLQTHANKIVYLASLVSDINRIDPWLDRLRGITSLHDPATPLSPEDEQTLLNLQAQLREYLINGDPLRRFEPEVLDQKIYENLQGHQHYSRLRMLVGIIVGLSIGMGIATALLAQAVSALSTVPQMPFLIGFVTFCFGAIFLLAQAARTFNRQLRQVYVMLCVVVVFVTMLIGQFSLFSLLKDSWWIKAWGFSVFYVGMSGFLYLAFRKLALQLEVTSFFIPKKHMLAIAAAAVVASILLPHTPAGLLEVVYDASIINIVLLILFSTSSVVLGRAVVHKVGTLYKRALWCLIVAAGSSVIGGCILLIIRLVWLSTGQAPPLVSMSTMLLSVVGGFTLLYAAYVFNKTSRY